MSEAKLSPKTIDEYIAGFPDDVQAKLIAIRNEVRALAPQATEKISYGIPTFFKGKNVFHFAALKGHIGLYPGSAAIEKFAAELECYKTSKGAIQVPLSHELPFDLIKKLVVFNLERFAVEPLAKRRK